MVLTACFFIACTHKLHENIKPREILVEDSNQMETMSYSCSPLIPYPPQHEESSYLLLSPQVVFPQENASIYDGDPSPDQQQDHGFLDRVVQEANDLLQVGISRADPLAIFDENLVGQENGSLVPVQEELMEEDSLRDLLTCAKAVEARDLIQASAIMSRINNLLHEIVYRSSSDHLAYYFAQSLQSKISGDQTKRHPVSPTASNRFLAYQMLQECSPFIKFAHFAANQAILEATMDDQVIHVVDFNIGTGVQWSSLMSDLAHHRSKSFHLTAVTTDADSDAGTHHTVARWLSEFAKSFSLPFRYNHLYVHSEEELYEFTKGCQCSVVISWDKTYMPYISISKFQMLLLGGVEMLQPKLVVLIEEELFQVSRMSSLATASFAEFLCEASHHFTAVLDSLAGCFCGGTYQVCLRLVEKEVLGPRIENSVRQYGSVTGGTNATGGYLDGFKACEISIFNIAQAKMLVGLFSRGFGVVHEKGRLALCWKDRPLTSVSVWTPI